MPESRNGEGDIQTLQNDHLDPSNSPAPSAGRVTGNGTKTDTDERTLPRRDVADADLVTVKPPKPSVDENHGEVAMWARRMARHLGLDGEDGPSLEPYARAFLQAIQLADHRLMDTRDSDEPTDKEQV